MINIYHITNTIVLKRGVHTITIFKQGNKAPDGGSLFSIIRNGKKKAYDLNQDELLENFGNMSLTIIRAIQSLF